MRAQVMSVLLVGLLPALASAQPVLSGTERRVTTNLGDQYDPAISGSAVVYTDYRGFDTDVWYYDLTTGQEVQVTTASGNQELSDVSNAVIVYTDYRTADVIAYTIADRATVNLTAGSNAPALNPAIGGRLVAWEDERDGSLEIYARDLDTGEERRLSVDAAADTRPAVANGVVVWERCSSGTCDVYAYDWATATSRRITEGQGVARRPDISGRHVVYEATRAGETDVYAYDLVAGVETRLSRPGAQVNPNVSGEYVAYEDLATGVYHIGLWHLPSGAVFQITGGATSQFLNDIDGQRIVYTDERNGHLDIYLYEFVVTFPSPVVDCAHLAGTVPVVDAVLERTTGQPDTFSVPFAATPGPALVCIENGFGGTARLSSARVWINSELVVGPPDFADDDGHPRALIEARATLAAANVLEARLTSKPGAVMRVRVYAGNRKLAPARPAMPGEPESVGGGVLGDAEPMPGYGCSQAGAAEIVPVAFVLLALLALMPRPSVQRVRSRRSRR